MNTVETQQRDCALDVAVCRAEIAKLKTEIHELNVSLAAAYTITLGGAGVKINSHRNSKLVLKPSVTARTFNRMGTWLKGTKAKSLFLGLPSGVQSRVYSIARKIGLV